MKEHEVIVVGAGISGLLCAEAIQHAGVDALVIEKSRGVGGRMATRRLESGRIDHGAQFFTVRDLRFQMIVDRWIEDGLCRTWFVSQGNELGAQGHVRYCGNRGMTDPVKGLARSLNVELKTRVESARYEDSRWILEAEGHPAYACRDLILTAPLPQSLDILDAGKAGFDSELEGELRNIRYQKGIALLAVMDGPSGLPGHGGKKFSDGPISWMADNQMKGISPSEPTLTVHSTADFAEAHWNEPIEEAAAVLKRAAESHLSATLAHWQCHRWRYAFPENPWHELCLHDAPRSLIVAGDAFGGARVEGAALSGLQAASEFLHRVGRHQDPAVDGEGY